MADPTVAAETCVAPGATEHQFEPLPGRDIAFGALTVTRVLPVKGKRLVGPASSSLRIQTRPVDLTVSQRSWGGRDLKRSALCHRQSCIPRHTDARYRSGVFGASDGLT
jgi:hypothetical protein